MLLFNLLVTGVFASDDLSDQIKKLPKEIRVSFIKEHIKVLFKKDSIKAKQQIDKAIDVFKSDQALLAQLYCEKGAIQIQQRNIDAAIYNSKKSLAIFEKMKVAEGVTQSVNQIIKCYSIKQERDKAIELLFQKLKQYEGNIELECILLDKLGTAFKELKNIPKAREYLLEAEAKGNSIADPSEQLIKAKLSIDKNLGVLYRNEQDFAKAEFYFNRAIALAESTNNDAIKATVLNSLGILYTEKKDYYNAIKVYEESLRIKEETDNVQGLSVTYSNLGDLYISINNFLKAESYLDRSYQYAVLSKNRSSMLNILTTYFKLYDKQRKYDKAYPYLKRAFHLRDSLYKTEIAEETSKLEAMFNSEKKQKEIELGKVQKQQLERNIEAKNRERNILIAGAGVLLISLFFSIRSYLGKKRANATLEQQNVTIQHQKLLVEEQHKEILDSITYAKRLQDAILPAESHVRDNFKEYFIYYKPKDIVAGDFYWMEKLGDKVLLAVADCTGHGVPGAMVSLVCSNALNRSVFEFGLTDPGMILDKSRELVLETFSKSHADVKDGMDISILSIDQGSGEVLWAGANNPLWFIKEKTFHEITANKQSIGKADHYYPYTTHKINVSKGDSLFLFSDGYADQFGGPKGKKLKYKQFQTLLVEGANAPIKQTETLISTFFDTWKDTLEQVDDVCIIGVRL